MFLRDAPPGGLGSGALACSVTSSLPSTNQTDVLLAAALANSTATVRAALAEGAARGVEVAAARDRARAAPRRDSGATYCGKRPGYRCRGHGSEKRCHPDASCN